MKRIGCFRGWAAGTAGVLLIAACALAQSKIVNCIAAVVNNEIITRADVEIAEALGIFNIGDDPDPAARRGRVLDKLIDRMLVLGQVREAAAPAPAQIDAEMARLLSRLGDPIARERLAGFGMSETDAREYVEKGLRFRRIIADRFGRSVSVTLKEIEAFYADTYTAARMKEGAAIKPLVQVLDAIEAEIKQAKIEVQASLWIETLRDQAEIEIRANCLK
jgi:hypothetical protein